MTWGEVIRKLKAAGFLEVRKRGRGSHRLYRHADGRDVWVAVHTKKDDGQLGNRILRDLGVD